MRKTMRTIQKEESHKKIIEAAGKLFREKGYTATGVDEVMSNAGLTAGAFYSHFESKADLLEETLKTMLEKSRQLLLGGLENLKGEEFLREMFSRYVSEGHRDQPAKGCPLPSLAGDLYRQSETAQELVSEHLQSLVGAMIPHLPKKTANDRQLALRMMSQAVGAVLLSRMVKGTELSQEIIASVRGDVGVKQ